MALALVAGCAVQPTPEPQPEPEPVVTPAPAVVPPPAPTPIVLPRVAILVSMDTPSFNDIAARLERALHGRVTRHLLGSTTKAKLAQSAPDQIVAIGLEAALLAKQVQQAGRPVVFCQVFNHVEHDLLAPHMHGVSLFPSFRTTFATWRALSPSLREVAVFTGPAFEEVVAPAVAAAAAQGIKLTHRSVNSDKDFLYQYKRLSQQVDGLWLLPDNRVLSRSVIQDVMSYSLRNGKQVAVFNEQLLRIGGLFSVTSNPDEVAAKVLQRLTQAAIPGAPASSGLTFLDEAVVRINPVIAQRLQLTIPESLRSHVVD